MLRKINRNYFLLLILILKAQASPQYFWGLFIFIIFLIGFAIFYFLPMKDVKIRELGGINGLEEAIGRSTEMGKPILYVAGLKPIPAVSAIAAMNILNEVAKISARYSTPIISPHNNPVTMLTAKEEIKEGFLQGGNPDLINTSKIFYITDSTFPYAVAVNSLVNETKPGAIFYMGTFYAESLILTEHAQGTGTIQIAGTDSVAQLPFFIVTCDFTLMGEELFASTAYIKKDTTSLKFLFLTDILKAFIILLIIIYNIGHIF